MNEEKKKHTAAIKKSEDFSEWYTQILINSEFIDYSAVSGCIVFRPDSYFVWDTLRSAVDALFKEAGIQNVYFPLFIPEKLLEKEKQHVKGFAPEVAWVTAAGNTTLNERLAIRPTSETIMYYNYSKWIRSWRDLPLRLNQWNTVVRWEFKHPTPLIRSREMMWNEGHTVFASKEEAESERDVVLGIYDKALKEYLALPGIMGQKTNSEKFAGAVASFSIEHLIPDGWACQGPDFHLDGQNFAKAFDISFINKAGKKEYAYQNTFAISTRELGVMVAIHGDDKGLIIPPKLARIQVVIVPIYNDKNKQKIISYSKDVYDSIKKSFRAHLDDSDAYSPGWKFNEWELKGIPIRIEIGQKEVDFGGFVAVRRDNGEKTSIKLPDANKKLNELLSSIHDHLYEKAKKFLQEHTHKVDSHNELKKAIAKGGFAEVPWCGSEECEQKIKEETSAKATNIPFDKVGQEKDKKCIYCGKKAKHIVDFARSY